MSEKAHNASGDELYRSKQQRSDTSYLVELFRVIKPQVDTNTYNAIIEWERTRRTRNEHIRPSNR